MFLVQLLRPSLWVDFFGGFSRGFCRLVSPRVSVAYFVVFSYFLDVWEKFHPDKHQLAKLSPLHIYIDVFIELLTLATGPSEKT